MFNGIYFGNQIKKLRLEKNINQLQLGSDLCVTTATISRIESGKRAVSLDMLISLAKYFGVSTDYLLGLTDDPRRL